MDQESAMTKRRKKKGTKEYSMRPDLNSEVIGTIDGKMKSIKFNNEDSDSECRELEVNLVGTFVCPNCRRSWKSGIVFTVVRLYFNNTYNAKVYGQRCKRCENASLPKLDETYAQRVSYKLETMYGIPHPKVEYRSKPMKPHDKHRCQGCKINRCQRSKMNGYSN